MYFVVIPIQKDVGRLGYMVLDIENIDARVPVAVVPEVCLTKLQSLN
jgi:hypothetical protein